MSFSTSTRCDMSMNTTVWRYGMSKHPKHVFKFSISNGLQFQERFWLLTMKQFVFLEYMIFSISLNFSQRMRLEIDYIATTLNW